MKTEMVDGEEIMVFDNREELKWYFHAKLCKGDSGAEYLMNMSVDEEAYPTVEDVNRLLEKMGRKVRVKEP